jgi:hypothetical protein
MRKARDWSTLGRYSGRVADSRFSTSFRAPCCVRQRTERRRNRTHTPCRPDLNAFLLTAEYSQLVLAIAIPAVAARRPTPPARMRHD